jgi:tRNA(fMet)-specific endonuclease VapC
MILLDTSAAILLLRGNAPPEVTIGQTVGLSSVVEMELWLGVYHGGGEKEYQRVESFLNACRIFPFDSSAAEQTAKVIAGLWSAGTPIGDFDAEIAGHAMALKMPLLSDNTKHFKRVKGLELIPWK